MTKEPKHRRKNAKRWQPIETLPDDNQQFRAAYGTDYYFLFNSCNGPHLTTIGLEPVHKVRPEGVWTHWMPAKFPPYPERETAP
jgi:hypothetical protein